LACNGDPLIEPLSRVDMDWLLALLGRRLEEPVPERPRATPRPEPPHRTEFIEGPPPAHPGNLSLPTADDRKPAAAPADERPRPARAQPAPYERRRETPPARQPEPPVPARPQSTSPERRRGAAEDSPSDRVNGPRSRPEPSSQPPAPPARPTQKTL